jgi:hypothetical protein
VEREEDELESLLRRALELRRIEGFRIEDDEVSLEIGGVRMTLHSDSAARLVRAMMRRRPPRGPGRRGEA